MKGKTINITEKNQLNTYPFVKAACASLKVILIAVLIVISLITGILAGAAYAFVKTAEPISFEQLKIDNKGLTSFIYDRKGNIIAKLTGSDNQNRELVESSKIPDNLKYALVAVEDERFYEHSGVDLKRTTSAVVYYFTGIGSKHGGSTITQQLVKNLTGKLDQTPQRKVQEQWNALQLEKQIEKWQILSSYLNMIYMGNSCYGVQAASRTYFGKNVWELSLAECALLAGITNKPGLYNPFTEDGRENAKERQELILLLMKEQGYINERQYVQAVNETLLYSDPNENKKIISVQTYFVDHVIEQVIKDLAEKLDVSRETASLKLYNDGYKVYTTQDPDVQRYMDEEFTNNDHFSIENAKAIKYGEKPQAAMVIVDPYTGEIAGMYGGAGEKKGNRTYNRATQLERHPGSSIKPIAVYAPAIDSKIVTSATIIDDTPVRMYTEYDGEELMEELYPLNFSRKYWGLVSVRDALKKSINVTAAKLWRDILGPDISLEYLEKVGIDRHNERYVSLALGGLAKGVSPLTMAGSYTAFVNKGVYISPIAYTKVTDENGNIVLEKNPAYNVAYDEASSYLMTDMMREVTSPGGTAYSGIGENFEVEDGVIPIGGKTGTSSDFIDKWFIGYTPYYIAATWYGYDNKVERIEIQKGEERMKAQRIWRAVMEKVHQNLAARDFDIPDRIFDTRTICKYSGKIATDLCRQDPRGNAARVEYFLKGTAPYYDDFCDVHVKAKVCTASTDIWNRPLLATEECPGATVVEKVFIQRKEPYVPEKPGDPYPQDWIYELPAAEYCTLHSQEGEHEPPADTSQQSGDGHRQELMEESD